MCGFDYRRDRRSKPQVGMMDNNTPESTDTDRNNKPSRDEICRILLIIFDSPIYHQMEKCTGTLRKDWA